MITQILTFPSLSGTFGIHTGLALNPKMPKEPSSPSLANARTEKYSAKIETEILRNNKGQRTTMCIIHKGFRGLRAISSVSIFGGNLIILKSTIPYEIIHSPLAHIKNNVRRKK